MRLIALLLTAAMVICSCSAAEPPVVDPQPVSDPEPVVIAMDAELEPLEIPDEPDPEPLRLEDECKPEPPKHYTDADAVALAQMVWGEARGIKEYTTMSGITVSGKCQQAAAMWSACNRFDAGYEESIAAVCAAPSQYHGYSAKHPVDEDLLELAYDVLERWNAERNGAEDVGRVLPSEYMWFYGDGKHNHFRDKYTGGARYGWELPDVYAESVEAAA